MTTTVAEAAVTLIEAAMPSFTFGTNLFISVMPPSPDVALCVYEYPGRAPIEHFADGGYSIDLPRVQVVSRGPREDYPTARDNALAARDALSGVTEQTVGSLHVMRIASLASLMHQGNDEQHRPKISVNFEAHVR